MPLFICEKCGAIENTALGFYWARKHVEFHDLTMNGKALCSECAPLKFNDGSDSGFTGKWHNKFPKEIYDKVKHKDWDIINRRTVS